MLLTTTAGVRDVSEWLAGGLLIAVAWGLAMLFNAVRGRRQAREGRGTRRRLWTVAALIALMQITPLLAAAGLSLLDLSKTQHGEALAMAVVVHFLTYALTWGIMGPPLRWQGSSEPLPEVADERFLSRYRAVCERKGLAPPVVRILRSLSGNLETMAYVGGLAAPSVVVTDGIIHRLEEDEANAVLAHELAHIANGSLWWYTAVWLVVGPVTAVLLAPWHSAVGALPVALAVAFVMRTVVSRWFEIDCDLRGARAVGFGQMAFGLEKVHKGLPYEQTGWKSLIAMSMSSHPSYDVRIGALAKKAPENDQVRSSWSRVDCDRSIIISTAVFVLWTAGLSTIVLSLVLSPAQSNAPHWLYLAASIVTPLMLKWSSTTKSARQSAARQAPQRRKANVSDYLKLLTFGLTCTILCAMVVRTLDHQSLPESDNGYLYTFGLLPSVVCLIALMLWKSGLNKLNLKVLQALQVHQWDEVLRLAQTQPKLVGKNAPLRHNVALAKWLSGQEDEALRELAEVEQAEPNLKQTYLTRGAMLLELGQATQALQEAERLHALDPLDYEAYVLAARAYLLQGDWESTAKQLVEAEKALPNQPTTLALRAAVAAKRGDLESAATLLDQAENLAPVLPLVRLLAAEVTLEHGPIDEAQRQITDATRLIHAAPLCLLQKQVQRLGERLDVETLRR